MKNQLTEDQKIVKRANQIARQHGYLRATNITRGTQDRFIKTTAFGYRKCSDGQYVPKAYLNNFGWKNTYYQHAECFVEVAVSLA